MRTATTTHTSCAPRRARPGGRLITATAFGCKASARPEKAHKPLRRVLRTRQSTDWRPLVTTTRFACKATATHACACYSHCDALTRALPLRRRLRPALRKARAGARLITATHASHAQSQSAAREAAPSTTTHASVRTATSMRFAHQGTAWRPLDNCDASYRWRKARACAESAHKPLRRTPTVCALPLRRGFAALRRARAGARL